ncbi:MAG: CHAT domain-containing protein [Fimbriimonadales bacterium]|nr:CHAT domain-containing protein [Fimbriimonadales bacterium]
MMLATIALSMALLEAPSFTLGLHEWTQNPPAQEQQKKEPQKPHPEVQALLDKMRADSTPSDEKSRLLLAAYRKAIELGDLPGQAYVLMMFGNLALLLDNQVDGMSLFEDALRMYRLINDVEGEANALGFIGLLHWERSDEGKALEYFEMALPLLRDAEDVAAEADILTAIGLIYADLGNQQQAIWQLKQAVNALQSLREKSVGLDSMLTQKFAEKYQSRYQLLAMLLTEEGRILEAQQVLNLLKDDELYQYIRRTEESLREKRVDYTPAEEKWSAEYEEISKGITAIGKEARELLQIKERSPEQQSKLDELNAKLEAANAKFQEFLDRVVAESSNLDSKTNRLEKVREAEALASTLARMPEGTVAVWTAISEKSLTLIVVTPNASVGRRVEIDIAEFQKKLLAFRQALSSDRFDPRPIGKEIYDLLVKPIQEDLIGANAKTIMWSLDGSLRYIPIAALWDGERYMIEKYGNVIFTAAAMSRLERDPLQSWTGVALGLTKEVDVEDPVIPGRKIRFVALPGVEFELSSVKGSMPGTDALLDDKFTIDELKRRLTMNPRVLHIASHFSFNPGDETRSFLVTGDGKAWTVAEVRSLPTGALESVAVLALSACDTALGLGADGSEVEGFAAWMQKKGAESVLATLWPVADPTTAAVMSEFYRLKISNPTWTKLQALHEAQMGLLLGRLEVEGAEVKRMEPAGKPPEGLELPVFVAPKNAPFSHPYYWAPFILAGNWR